MPLEMRIEQAGYDGLDEALKALYKQDGSGYRLDVNLPGPPADKNPNKDLQKQLKEALAANKQLQEQVNKDVLNKAASLEEAKVKFGEQMDAARQEHAAELAKLQQKADKASGQLGVFAKSQAIATALAAADFNEAGMKFVPQYLDSKLEFDGETVKVIGDEKGTVEGLVKGIAKEFPAMLKAKGAGGTGTQPTETKPNGAAGESKPYAEFMAMSPEARGAWLAANPNNEIVQ